ncbi:hypothetical protein D3C80_1412900 [compost metagenome]
MALDEDGIEILNPVITGDHLMDHLANLQRTFLVSGMNVIGAAVEPEQIVGDTQHRMIFADLDLDAATAQGLNRFIKNGAAHLLGLFQFNDFFLELNLPLLQLLLNLHQLQDQNHRGQNEDHQQRRHDVREGHPVRILLVDADLFGFAQTHQRASSSSRMLLMFCTMRCI